MNVRCTGKGGAFSPGVARGRETTCMPVSGSTSVVYRLGTYTPGSWASCLSRSARGMPASRPAAHTRKISGVRSSPSPLSTASRNAARGSGWVAVGPPAITSGW